jgi:aminoglycoside phosphotransferase (APT) family kinase protein
MVASACASPPCLVLVTPVAAAPAAIRKTPRRVTSAARQFADLVIDWANARRGDPAIDVTKTWSLLVCGEPPGGRFERAVVALARGLVLRTFLASTDQAGAQRVMPALVEWRMQDRNHTDAERRRLARLVR